ncbi:unnamed protein product [Lactuca saligna]|uniref:Uncharacterized protein n=1 Tax=Lactuca saligna TaxID=75948 RepID=A0AA35Y8B2_LACSI|nr:unnamed protein product [Lactuca saligna]
MAKLECLIHTWDDVHVRLKQSFIGCNLFCAQQPSSSWLNQRPPLDVHVACIEGSEDADKGGANQPTTQVVTAMCLKAPYVSQDLYNLLVNNGVDDSDKIYGVSVEECTITVG